MIMAMCARVRAQQQQDHALCRNFANETTERMFYDKKKLLRWDENNGGNYSMNWKNNNNTRSIAKRFNEVRIRYEDSQIVLIDSISTANQSINELFVWLLIV